MAGREEIAGTLVSLPARGAKRPLDGFWAHGAERQALLLVFVHGMGGNFYRSAFKRETLAQGPGSGFDALSFHNRGHLDEVVDERFGHCLADLDAVVAFAKRKRYRGVVLLGHSTGCQKIIYYQARRRSRFVRALVLAAPADDAAIARRDLGKKYASWIRRARKMVATRRGHERLPPACLGFTARRWLSCADPRSVEARILDYEGPMTHFRRLSLPVLAFFGEAEEFAVLDVHEMGRRLAARSAAQPFAFFTIPGANHGFGGAERRTVQRMYRWLREVPE